MTRTARGLNARPASRSRLTGRPMPTQRLASTTGTASSAAAKPATDHGPGRGSNSSSRPMSRNSTALRISSTSSQKVSRCSRVALDMARRRPWLPMSSPVTTIASGADRCSAAASA